MAIRGVYTEDEKKLIAMVDKMRGYITYLTEELIPERLDYPLNQRLVTKDTIRQFCDAIGDDNPLFRDDKYAKRTKYGTVIAPPMFINRIAANMGAPTNLPGGGPAGLNAGSKYEFFKPIRVGDSFVVKDVWFTSFDDKTKQDGTGPRRWLSESKRIYINQLDETVCIGTRRRMYTMRGSNEHVERVGKLPVYKYTKAEFEYIDRVLSQEERRGLEPRFREDVNVGDELKTVVRGPGTPMDQGLTYPQAGEHFHSRLYRKYLGKGHPGLIINPDTGILHWAGEVHILDRIAENDSRSQAFVFGFQEDFLLGILISNWMGDEGFLKVFDTQNRFSTPFIDTDFAKGKVIKKYVKDKEHLVDLAIWVENIRGFISILGKATVVLPWRGEFSSEPPSDIS